MMLRLCVLLVAPIPRPVRAMNISASDFPYKSNSRSLTPQLLQLSRRYDFRFRGGGQWSLSAKKIMRVVMVIMRGDGNVRDPRPPVVRKKFRLRSSGSPFSRFFQKQRVTEFIDVEPQKCPRSIQEKSFLSLSRPEMARKPLRGRGFGWWRDPESNRGHKDFQSLYACL